MKFYKLIFFFFIVIFLIGCISSNGIAENEKLSAPNNLVAWQSGEYIQLRYDFDYEEQYEYNIYRSPNLGVEWEKLNFTPFPLNNFVDYNPLVYETLYYKVVRIDFQGNEGLPAIIKVQFDTMKIPIRVRSKASFDKNNIISDQQLINFPSMSLWDIQNFLSDHGSYLATYYFDSKSAAQHICDACQEHQINPQVILTTLQKEQGLITKYTVTQAELNWAMGWGSSSDFGSQVYWGTKQFRRYYDDLESYGWSVGESHAVYDGVVTSANIATAGLYIYTPWIGEGGGGASGVGGNYLFWDIWYNNFGFNGTTSLAPPPELVYPPDNSTIYTTTPTFKWNSVSTADGYGLYIKDIASGEMVYETEAQPLYGTSLKLPGGILENGRSYWWNMNSYNSAGWGSCCTHWKFTVQVDSYPTVNSFSVNYTSVTLGNSFDISYTVSDDIDLQQTELWRANDVGGTLDWDTPNNPIKTKILSGQTNYSGSFTDSPGSIGTYYYGIHVLDSSGNMSLEPDPPGPIKVTVTDPTINPPTGVSATDGTYTDKVRIIWNSVSGASYYHVYRATSSGGYKISLGSWQGSTAYDDTSVTPGQNYYYFVTAATSSSGSNPSDYSTYNDGWRKLSPPSGVNATDGTYTDKIRITWNSVSGASYYHVYRATSSGGYKISLGSWQGSTSYDDTSAIPGQTYYYFNKAATNSSGYRESDYSSYNQGFCSVPTYPPQVTTNNDSNLTSNSAQLNGNLDSTGGLDCLVWFEHGKTTSYGISTTKQSKSSTGPFNEVISGLDANTVYYFRACASNSKGPDYGDDKTFTTKANRPGAAAFSNVTKINIQANWSANGNPSGTQYYCENTTKGTNSAWITNLYWNSTGLSANTTYHFQVKAKNKDGVGTSWIDLGSQKTEISDTTPPPAPIISSSTQPDEDKWYSNDDSVFNWATPSDSSGIAGYSYELNNSLSTVPDTTVDTTSNSKSYSNLSSGIWYFHIRAKDGVGNWGNADYYKVKIDTIFPDTSITSSGPNGTIDYNDVSFTFVGSDNLIQASNLIYSYYLYGYDSGYSAFSSNTTKSYSNLPNASYTFYVKAKDEAGNVDSSPASRSFTVNYTPTAPELFLKKSADKQTVNPSEILTYSIVYDNDGTESAQNVVIEDIIPDGMTYVANSASTNNFYHTGSVTVEVKVNNAWKVDSTTPGGLVTAVRWIFGSNISADDGDNYGSAEDESPNTGDTDAGKVTLQVTIN